MRSRTPYFSLFGLASLVGMLVIVVLSYFGAPDWITFPAAVVATLSVFVICVRLYTPWPEPPQSHAIRGFGVRLFTIGPSPSLEQFAEELEAGARKRSRGTRRRKANRTHGKHRGA